MAMIVHAMNMWRNYILGKMFVMMSDHSGFRYMFDQTNLNSRKCIWLAMISEFNFEIKYIKGNENKVANFLRIRV